MTRPVVRYLLFKKDGILDTSTGEIYDHLTPEILLANPSGGVIAGRNLYGKLAPLVDSARRDEGWSAKIHVQQQRSTEPDKVSGVIYFSHLTHKIRKQVHGKRKQTTTKWLVLNLELFSESLDVESAAKGLVDLAQARGISPRYSPGSFGSALLRASSEWEHLRRPAPWFISEAARQVLPGNYYAIRNGHRRADRCYYLDQKSSHHSIASQIVMPHPHYLRARGRFRSVEKGDSPVVFTSTDILRNHVGVIVATITCNHIPPNELHLYPQWARQRGTYQRWIWTPELRLLDDRVKIDHISAALTSIRGDWAINEYASWALSQLSKPHDPSVKPALLAAYGMLAVRTDGTVTSYSAHGRKKPDRAEVVTLPLLDKVFRSTVERTRVPSIQNVVARGTIEAEVRTRSIEMARKYEDAGFPVVHIYADGIIVQADQLPFTPDGWRIQAALTNVSSPAPHSVLSNEMVRLPGIPNGRRTMYIRKDDEGLHLREREPRPIIA